MIKWEGEGDKERFKVVNYFRKKTPSQMLDWALNTSPGDHIRLGVQHAESTIYRRFLRKRYKFYKKQVTPMLKILGRSRLNVAHRENYVNILFNFRKKYFLNNLMYNLCFFLCFTINSLDKLSINNGLLFSYMYIQVSHRRGYQICDSHLTWIRGVKIS